MRFSRGDTFDRYVIEALIGEGGMGEVYRAEDTRLGRKVALKMLRADNVVDDETWSRAVARMQREARAVASLSHPSIVAVYDVAEHAGIPYIAMELVDGKPLRVLIGADIPQTTRLGILLDVAKALAIAHQSGIVHRDVKPENILVNDRFVVKVLDFGIARFRPVPAPASGSLPIAPNAPNAPATMTAEGTFLGTPAYMAPEQLRGEELDGRADQFAWGIVAFELLSGKLPFRTDKGAISLMASILSDTPPALADVPSGINELVQRALEKAPDDRFASMAELVAAFSELLAGNATPMLTTGRRPKAVAITGETSKAEPKPASPASPASRAYTERARRLRLRFAAPLLLLGLVGVGWVFFKANSRSHEMPAPMPSALAPPAPRATAVTDLPLPPTESAEARLAYREGLQAVRDAAWDTAAAAFDRARKADPSMTAAHLRYAMFGMFTNLNAAQEAFRKASLLRGSLSERDQGFLDAFAPVIQNMPSDTVAAQRKFALLSERFPGDAEIVFWNLRMTSEQRNDGDALEQSIRLADRCLELDPKYADCWQTKGRVLERQDKRAEAVVALDRCIELSMGAPDCLEDKIRLASRLGQCAAVAETAKRWMGQEPNAPKPYAALAGALYYAGEPEAAVVAAMEQAMKRYRALDQAYSADEIAVYQAMAFGDFERASKLAETLAKESVAPHPAMAEMIQQTRVLIKIEQGKTADAARLADEFLAQNALQGALRIGPGQVNATVLFQAARLRQGKMTRAEFDAARAEWIAKQPKESRSSKFLVWRDAYVAPLLIMSSDTAALDMEPEFAPRPAGSGPADVEPAVATTFAIARVAAGKLVDAAPWLEKATATCGPAEVLLWQMKLMVSLGNARAAQGDTKGACEAYQRVLFRWGKAKDSVTAKEAAKRSKESGCEGSAKLGDRQGGGRVLRQSH